MKTNGKSKSAEIRARLGHPVIDSDGHMVEYVPAFFEYLKKIGGDSVVRRYREAGFGFGCTADWYRLSPAERTRQHAVRPPWWALPTSNTLDRATSTLPRLLHERLDEMGIDFTVLYPSLGLDAPYLADDEVRQAACRALNTMYAELFAEFSDRMTPAGIIPMNTPGEAIAELEYATKTLGLKAFMMATHAIRPVPLVNEKAPELSRYARYIDNFCIDSAYDYDPVWAKCIELRVAPGFHSSGMGWGSRTTSNYMFNHIGHFASACEALCKGAFISGVTRRFPKLRLAFLECGVWWACALYGDLIGRWEKRSGEQIHNYNPASLNRELYADLFRRYGGRLATAEMMAQLPSVLEGSDHHPEQLDDLAACRISKKEDIRDLFVPNFYFGCEADDPTNAFAFDRKCNPMGARLNAIFSSDIGHWDVPDMREVVEEAYELVEHEVMNEDDFRDFVFGNPARLFTEANPDFFKGTRVEDAVKKFLGSES
ncbi:MAG: amidohydrolase family protein [Candidatus Binatus sp.]|uniref:amidohydrolase family protein n=1 Tax=Candidatus Binatus sp. TaxID=2811406 RepID=UPI002724DF11|nr:amidohydrolase family protein [Candidatus Binatus sp.]MDO8434293.1 amidohydrolase family protein [Candidatus Binatus sp.]